MLSTFAVLRQKYVKALIRIGSSATAIDHRGERGCEAGGENARDIVCLFYDRAINDRLLNISNAPV